MGGMYTKTQIAERLKVSPQTVQSWITSGELVACDVRRAGGIRAQWRITQASLDSFIERREKGVPKRQNSRKLAARPVKSFV